MLVDHHRALTCSAPSSSRSTSVGCATVCVGLQTHAPVLPPRRRQRDYLSRGRTSSRTHRLPARARAHGRGRGWRCRVPSPLAIVMAVGPGRDGPASRTPTSLHRAHARAREAGVAVHGSPPPRGDHGGEAPGRGSPVVSVRAVSVSGLLGRPETIEQFTTAMEATDMRLPSRLTRAQFGLTVVVLTLALPSVASATDWPQFHRSADRGGFNASEATLGPGNLDRLGPSWRTPLGNALVTAPVVAGESVYVGTSAGRLYALDRRSGSIRWSAPAGESVIRAAAVEGDRVFVGSESGLVFAFPTSCSTPCAPLWSTATAGRISSPPAVADGRLFVGAASGTDGELGQ